MMKIIQQGAEAIIYHKGDKVIKDRISKSYRLPALDEKIRKIRTRKEIKLLEKASKIIPIPKITNSKEKFSIEMQFVEGKKLSESLDSLPNKEAELICSKIGENIAKLHNINIIHGDLTTSNMIFNEKESKLYFIDFGLGYDNGKTEDKAVDLHLLKQALEAKHFGRYPSYVKWILESYKKHSKSTEAVLKRLEKVESRGRYKERY